MTVVLKLPRILAALAAWLLWAAPLSAQTVRGRLVESESGRPVAGALVQLLAAPEAVVLSMTSAESGGFTTPPVSAGRYRLRILRIGFQPWLSEPFVLADGSTLERLFQVPAIPLVLADITVEATSPCRASPAADRRMALLWDEARNALGLVGVGSGIDLEFRMTLIQRRLDPMRRLLGENQWPSLSRGAWPIVSQAPESLAAYGFVQPRDSVQGPIYFGPDVAAFFSDAFLTNHCFRLLPPPRREPDLLGLGFEPVKGRPVPDISGVLWLDRKGGVLRRLEFRYTGLWSWVPKNQAGGTIEFARIRTGQPIVSGWVLRAPVARIQPWPAGSTRHDDRTSRFFGNSKVELHGYREDQGRVDQVHRLDGTLVWDRAATGDAGLRPDIPSRRDR